MNIKSIIISQYHASLEMLKQVVISCPKSLWVNEINLEGESGFSWIPMGKMELQFYNIRHLQQHIGELCERL